MNRQVLSHKTLTEFMPWRREQQSECSLLFQESTTILPLRYWSQLTANQLMPSIKSIILMPNDSANRYKCIYCCSCRSQPRTITLQISKSDLRCLNWAIEGNTPPVFVPTYPKIMNIGISNIMEDPMVSKSYQTFHSCVF